MSDCNIFIEKNGRYIWNGLEIIFFTFKLVKALKNSNAEQRTGRKIIPYENDPTAVDFGCENKLHK